MSHRTHHKKGSPQYFLIAVGFFCIVAAAVIFALFVLPSGIIPAATDVRYRRGTDAAVEMKPMVPVLDTVAYDRKMLDISHVATSSPWYAAFLNGTTTASTTVPRPVWPVKVVYPNGGALLPFNRIVAYYGNFYSKGMGVLGQYPEDVMLKKLASTTDEWRKADPSTPVIPAIHYIVETAQGSPTKTGLYMARMPDDQIDKALELAKQINGLVFIDFQVGYSNVQTELPMYEKYLAMPNVHVGIDPEFSMKNKVPPGREIGTFDATDVNWTAEYLAKIVRDNHLPPKILVVHRFTEEMMTRYKRITPLPEVQIVIDMDGWGFAAKKINTFQTVVQSEPVQFAGFKLFYKNDALPPSKGMMTPKEVLELTPAPIYIQYQ